MNEEILSLRQEITNIDKNLTNSLEKRFEITDKIGKIKRENNFPIEDKEREKEIIQNKKEQTNLNPEFIEELFIAIMKESKSRQNEP